MRRLLDMFSLAFALLLCSSLPLLFASEEKECVSNIKIRENNADISIQVFTHTSSTLPNNNVYDIKYSNDENCGNNGHKTKGMRFFEHYHTNVPWNTVGYDSSGQSHVLTAAKMKAYWDNNWGIPQRWGTTSSGGESVSTNCWAYAFGYFTWVEDPAYIYADDYESISQPETSCVIQQPGHVIKISNVVTYENGGRAVSRTSEKMNMSGIYNVNYALPAGASLSGVLGGALYRKK
ncbi:hypothetical protein FACS1894189_7870 [Planctomycetales bacterium]|nr:hypothetical protein FACS1894189_7870 [Planctomycetales bacterium]